MSKWKLTGYNKAFAAFVREDFKYIKKRDYPRFITIINKKSPWTKEDRKFLGRYYEKASQKGGRKHAMGFS